MASVDYFKDCEDCGGKETVFRYFDTHTQEFTEDCVCGYYHHVLFENGKYKELKGKGNKLKRIWYQITAKPRVFLHNLNPWKKTTFRYEGNGMISSIGHYEFK